MAEAMVSMAALTCCSLTRQSASAITWFISATVSVITVGPVVKPAIIPNRLVRREGHIANRMSVIMPIGTKPAAVASDMALVSSGVTGIMAGRILTGSNYEKVAVCSMWPDLRRSRRLAGRRYCAGDGLGRCPGRLGMSGLWCRQRRLRDDRNRLINGAGL